MDLIISRSAWILIWARVWKRVNHPYIEGMKQFVALTAALMIALPAAAQDGDKKEGLSLIERGAELFLRGLMKDIEPAIDDFRTLAEEFGPQMQELLIEMGPKLEELLEHIDDITNYEAPEILPNGDIIIRRKPDAPHLDVPEAGIEL